MAQRNNNNAEMPPNSGIVSEEYQRGHLAIFGRRCKTKGCESDMSGAPKESLWCMKCRMADIEATP